MKKAQVHPDLVEIKLLKKFLGNLTRPDISGE